MTNLQAVVLKQLVYDELTAEAREIAKDTGINGSSERCIIAPDIRELKCVLEG